MMCNHYVALSTSVELILAHTESGSTISLRHRVSLNYLINST